MDSNVRMIFLQDHLSENYVSQTSGSAAKYKTLLLCSSIIYEKSNFLQRRLTKSGKDRDKLQFKKCLRCEYFILFYNCLTTKTCFANAYVNVKPAAWLHVLYISLKHRINSFGPILTQNQKPSHALTLGIPGMVNFVSLVDKTRWFIPLNHMISHGF